MRINRITYFVSKNISNKKALDNGDIFSGDVEILKKDNTLTKIRANVFPIKDSAGKVIFWATVTHTATG